MLLVQEIAWRDYWNAMAAKDGDEARIYPGRIAAQMRIPVFMAASTPDCAAFEAMAGHAISPLDFRSSIELAIPVTFKSLRVILANL